MDKQTMVHQHNGILFKNKKKQAIKKKETFWEESVPLERNPICWGEIKKRFNFSKFSESKLPERSRERVWALAIKSFGELTRRVIVSSCGMTIFSSVRDCFQSDSAIL